MLSLYSLVALGAIGALLTEGCTGPRRFLASTGHVPGAFVWPGEEVTLYCRPSRPGSCRWYNGHTLVGNACHLTTSTFGMLHCKQGDELTGSFHLRRPDDATVILAGRPSRGRDVWNPFLRAYAASPSYATHSDIKSAREQAHLCSQTGIIVSNNHICDGIDHCRDGEDEQGCELPCGAPAVGNHSALAVPAQSLYPSGANVTYHCQSGFSFSETLSGLNRTCRMGRWMGPPPVCRRNVAFNQTVTEAGPVMSGEGKQAAVDGQVDTWSLFVPTSRPQSLSVATQGGVTRVLVRSPSVQYRMSLHVHNATGAPVSCACQPNRAPAVFPRLSGEAVCTCPPQPGPANLVISSEPATFMGLAVAEMAALRDDDDAPPAAACDALDAPAHGSLIAAGNSSVQLSCSAGFQPSCAAPVACADIARGRARPACRPLSCAAPPVLPHTEIRYQNGSGWHAVAEYACVSGYSLYPVEQTTESVCADGLWSLSHVRCLPDSDVRVVTMRLRQQHTRSVTSLRAELEGLFDTQIQMLRRQQEQAHQRLRKLESALQGLKQHAGQRLVDERERLQRLIEAEKRNNDARLRQFERLEMPAIALPEVV